MPSSNQKKQGQMPASGVKSKSAMDTLLDSMDRLTDSAAERMTPEELRKARKEINESIDRVAAAGRQRRRETA